MPRAFASISFTPSVKAAQSLYRSREANQGFELAEDARAEITEREAEFIEARDSFYQATVNEDGWPYVQHRGGPAGFLKVLDAHTIGFADFSGNRQYISVGNLLANDRIALILMDYKEKRRLKIWGRVQIVHEREAPDVIAGLEMPAYRARIERAFLIRVEAWDWNCPQHITARYTENDIDTLVGPMQAEIADLKTQLVKTTEVKQTHGEQAALDQLFISGPSDHAIPALDLIVSGVRQLTPLVRAIELRAVDGQDLPPVDGGAHLALPVLLKNGKAALRHYSIASNPARRDIYEIAVRLQTEGEGGSAFVHEHYSLGRRLLAAPPRNYFVTQKPSRPAVLIAGGIGITAIKPIAQQLAAQQVPFTMHYAARSQNEMTYGGRLSREFGTSLRRYASDQGQRLSMSEILETLDDASDIYACGPQAMLDELLQLSRQMKIDPSRVHIERFTPTTISNEKPITLHLRRSQRSIEVSADQTVLQALEAAEIPVASSCGTGQCGTCAIPVLAGEVDHRDAVLDAHQKQTEKLFCPCVSRALGDSLSLDL
ncbi:pyridoxamine 5'-phosphate oxidase family protein [Undibacterium cyanobacteriorum]|uniref:Pyridoxamine 5'-phosphate oxidase family protein n=1 Tax=Undibacterium cyanobacteriorum TaxID=3073561 RepID=A0ABY9RI67_9BURK|nr:pyridoxamine 5'-phosphate oxidase family protein [Undibacterium sp. 20NA77.5]WMW80867.1 pyridoxamine 5'-phosphate oxidase family protein [Undibacterium sp. 20NA77.5]